MKIKLDFVKVTVILAATLIIFISIIVIGNTLKSSFGAQMEIQKQQYRKYSEYAMGLKEMENLKVNNANLDSIVEIVRCNQILLLTQQENLVNDIRQETNNIIDKANLWLSFSMGLMSLVGVFIPIALQYKIRSEDKSQLNKTFDEIQKFEEHYTEIFNTLQRNVGQEIDDEIQKLCSESKIQEFRSKFLSLAMGYEERTLSAIQIERECLLRHLWDSTIKALDEVINDCFPKKCETKSVSEEKKAYLIECFLFLYSFIFRMKMTSTMRGRHWNKLTDDIRFLLMELNHYPQCSSSWAIIKRKIDLIMEDIHKTQISSVI